MKTVSLTRASQRENRNASIFVAAALNVSLFLALLGVLSIPALARTSQQEHSREKLGALTSLGEVYVNDLPTSVMSAVSSGDKIRTGEAGGATLAVAGKGTLKIPPLSQVVLSGNDQYTAELEKGTVQWNSVPGSDGLIVRIGNHVVVPSVRSIATTLRVTKAQDGSFLVYCLDGKIDVLTVEGNFGQLLQAGQSLTVSAKSELLASSPAPKSKRNSHMRWILLGLAGSGAAAAAALAHRGGNQTVTLSAPQHAQHTWLNLAEETVNKNPERLSWRALQQPVSTGAAASRNNFVVGCQQPEAALAGPMGNVAPTDSALMPKLLKGKPIPL